MNERRKGVSPVVATVMIITITLVVGFAVFSFVNSEAAVASGAMGESTATYVNYLRERFVITNVAFDYPTDGQVTVWFYNNGAVNTKFKANNGQIFIGITPTPTDQPTGWTSSPVTVEVRKSNSITFYYPTTSGTTYYIKAVGEFGNVVLYYQKA
ncbi:MAG: hypothetical protein H3Z53_09710 [archaeon]|nr:hypothetical protein [archaeon]MCP8314626.1 hypothetical protein [archaeon]MCP8316029.1 hypothetical protein [archaeon]MCP8321753.1 hypothetical protein [archaeon]